MRVAIVHHWFVTLGGGERVAEVLAGMYPEAELFSLLAEEGQMPQTLRRRKIHTSFLQRIPGACKMHRHLLPLYPYAVEALDLTGFDLVITSDSGPMKGIVTNPHATHICYCHSPMRYVWDGYNAYMRGTSALARIPFSMAAHYVRNWDYIAAQRVDRFVANSRYVAYRIGRYYGRESAVIHPPVETGRGRVAAEHEDFYLAAGRLVGYKKTDLMIEACNRLGRRLRVVGDGPEYKRLKRMAGPTIEFTGLLSDEELWENYAKCRALLFAADEDFGMVPLEAQACGRPVIAYGKGGSLETVRGLGMEGLEAPTGLFFEEQTGDSLATGIARFEGAEAIFQPEAIQRHARRFDTQCFVRKMERFIEHAVATKERYGMDGKFLEDASNPEG